MKSNEVYELMKQNILSFKYKPGHKLNIREISRETNMSDIPIREALKMLETEGFVEFEKNKGAKVKEFDLDEFDKLCKFRIEIEALATRWAVPNIGEHDIKILNEYVMKMDYCISKNKIAEYELINSNFHQHIYGLCNSQILMETLSNLFARTKYTKSFFNLFPERLKNSNEEHKEILKALIEKDEKLAENTIRVQKINSTTDMINKLRAEKEGNKG